MLSGYRIIHVKAHTVPAYTYKRFFTIKDKPEKAMKAPKPPKSPKKTKKTKKTAAVKHKYPWAGTKVSFA